jgi:hypothetical protein
VSATDVILGGGLSIGGKEQIDNVTVTRVNLGGDFNLDLGDDTNSATVSNLVAFGVSIKGGKGVDSIRLTDVRATDAIAGIGIETGEGDDTLTMTRVSTAASIEVKTDKGNDTVTATTVSADGDILFDGGDDNDLFDNNGVTAGGLFEFINFEMLL